MHSTTTFVAGLKAAGHHQVVDFPELDFDFVDREIFLLRSTTIPVEGRSSRCSIDLLLRASNGLPIVGEVKVGGDSLTYYALVQALTYAAELSSESQLRRLGEHYDFIVPAGQAVINICLIAHAAPERGAPRRLARREQDDRGEADGRSARRHRDPAHGVPGVDRGRRRSSGLQAPVLSRSVGFGAA